MRLVIAAANGSALATAGLVVLAGAVLLVVIVVVIGTILVGLAGGGAPPPVAAGTFTPGNPLGDCHPTTTQAYGPTTFTLEPRLNGVPFHAGIDLACPPGSTIFSVTDGVVYHAAGGCPSGPVPTSCHGGAGNHVVVRLTAALPGDAAPRDYYVVYYHMLDTPFVAEGQAITAGTPLGREGTSGNSTGPHLHFEVDAGRWLWTQSIDPRPFLALYINPQAGPPLG